MVAAVRWLTTMRRAISAVEQPLKASIYPKGQQAAVASGRSASIDRFFFAVVMIFIL